LQADVVRVILVVIWTAESWVTRNGRDAETRLAHFIPQSAVLNSEARYFVTWLGLVLGLEAGVSVAVLGAKWMTESWVSRD
jgi:hypothetical protein